MAISKDNQVKEGKKTAEKKVTEKTIKKTPNPSLKRGQPTAAARLISSPYVKFGWHKPLGCEIKETVQQLSSTADSMYMLQISRDRPIDSLPLRNGIFWEHRQLQDASIVSTPALDHIDLFAVDDESFQDTIQKIGKQQSDDNGGFLLHYLFESLRSREFLLLPFQIGGNWVTIITRMRPKTRPDSDLGIDREVTDLAIVDPEPNGRESRRELINRRLLSILAEGCIQLSTEATVRDIIVPNLACGQSWQSGLVAYALSREFLRRLKVLQFRKSCASGSSCENFLWAAFEEQYNFDAYRQNLMSACAHQTIEASAYQVRLALEVPSDDANYQPSLLRPLQNQGVQSSRDEKWDIFQSPTHTLTVDMCTDPGKHSYSPSGMNSGARNLEDENHCVVLDDCNAATSAQELPSCGPPEFTSPSYTSKSVSGPVSPSCSPTSLRPNRPSSSSFSPTSPTSNNSPTTPSYSSTSSLSWSPICAGTGHQNAPVAPMGPLELSPQTEVQTIICYGRVKAPQPLAEDQSAKASRKRRFSEDGDVEEPPQKRLKTEDES
ncbi:hypothetical protein F4782DRAFT_247274 [Xylaria castorea]|nr:hypothetical protein F4782DRAFT_247274 [Xylaria castorea]